MNVAELDSSSLHRRLSGPGLRLRTGRVVTSIRSHLPAVFEGIRLLYADFPVEPDDGFADFRVEVRARSGFRRWLRPQVDFCFEGTTSFNPLPLDQAFPMLEWGLNWCVSSHCHNYVILHAAVVERNERAIVFPAPPGSGKSTLCAALVLSGWRLLSDELALLDPESGSIHPIPRPVGLKNASIDVIRTFYKEAVFGHPVRETIKGTVAHMKPPTASVLDADRVAAPGWIIFPRYVTDSATRFAPLPKGQAFMRLVDNAFNYDVHGRGGFDTVGQLVESSSCFELEYSRLNEALALFTSLADQ